MDDEAINLGEADILTSLRFSNSTPMATLDHEEFATSQSDDDAQLCALFTELTSSFYGRISIEATF